MNLTCVDKMRSRATERPHGSYLRYWEGCRCFRCREAQGEYASRTRRLRKLGQGNPIVSAQAAGEHLRKLKSEHGITTQAVSLCTGIPANSLIKIRSGNRKNIRKRRERIILAVGADATEFEGSLPAERTRQHLDALRAAGLNQRAIGRALHKREGRVEIATGERVRRENARKVQLLYNAVVLMPRRVGTGGRLRTNTRGCFAIQ